MYTSSEAIYNLILKHHEIIKSMQPAIDILNRHMEGSRSIIERASILNSRHYQNMLENSFRLQEIENINKALSSYSQLSKVISPILSSYNSLRTIEGSMIPNFAVKPIFDNYNILELDNNLRNIVENSKPSVFFDYQVRTAFDEIEMNVKPIVYDSQSEVDVKIDEPNYITPEMVEKLLDLLDGMKEIIFVLFQISPDTAIIILMIYWLIKSTLKNHLK